MSLGKNVKEYRIKRELQQNELALILGVTSPTISNIERDIKTPSLKNLKKLAYVLRCTVADLMKD